MALCSGLPGWACTRKVKPVWISLKRETVSGSGISWAVCKSAPRSRQITTPAPHHSVFTGWMPFLPPNQQCQSTEGTVYKHTHTFNGPFPGLPGWACTRKVKPVWISLKQETVSGSGISWAVCKSAPRSRQITTPAPHHSVFLQAGCPSCRPTNSIKAKCIK